MEREINKFSPGNSTHVFVAKISDSNVVE